MLSTSQGQRKSFKRRIIDLGAKRELEQTNDSGMEDAGAVRESELFKNKDQQVRALKGIR